MPILFPRISAAALTVAFFVSGDAAFAQQQGRPAGQAPAQPKQQQLSPPQQAPQQPQGPVKLDLVAVQPDWTKVCGSDPQTKKEICYTTRDFGTQADQPLLALAVYDPKGDDHKIVRLLLPPGLMLRPGFRFAVDKSPMESGAFEICFPNGCFAEAKVKNAIVDGVKKGEKLTVVVKNQVNNEVTFSLPLVGFGKAFDGPPIDPKVLEAQQKRLQEELQKKAEDERKKLEAQKSAAPAPAPAPGGK